MTKEEDQRDNVLGSVRSFSVSFVFRELMTRIGVLYVPENAEMCDGRCTELFILCLRNSRTPTNDLFVFKKF